jgi:(p)ppGpp synthase/HD superfamily hydrolase
MREEELIAKAQQIATAAHKGQTRWDGSPYIEHPAQVASNFPNEPLMCATAWLHDVLEDTDITYQDLLAHGIPDEVVNAVISVTLLEGEHYLDLILRARVNRIGREVKIADIKHNLSTLNRATHRQLYDKYELALQVMGCNPRTKGR